jgi:D-threo-aldose 1-dehydrogenase
MDHIATRRIGTTALSVTELGFGAAPIGGFRATISEAEAQALLEAAWQGGMRFFDTSPFYGYGALGISSGNIRERNSLSPPRLAG